MCKFKNADEKIVVKYLTLTQIKSKKEQLDEAMKLRELLLVFMCKLVQKLRCSLMLHILEWL